MPGRGSALLVLVLATAACAQTPVELEPERATRATIDDWHERHWQTFVVDVPEDAVAVQFIVEDAPVDLDLFAREGEPIEDHRDEDVASASTTRYNDVLALHRGSQPPLVPGLYYVDVVYAGEGEPRAGKARLDRIPFSIRARIVHARIDAAVRPGTPLVSNVDPDDGSFRTFVVDVPPGAEALRIDLDEVRSDLDLRVRRGDHTFSRDDADATAETSLGRETIVLDGESEPPLAPGRYYVNVFDPLDVGIVPFTIHVTLGHEPPARLQTIPPFRVPIDALDQAVLCTVELLAPEGGGSGTLISPDGLILTNQHVVETAAGGLVGDGELVIGVTHDARVPSLELFRARVVESDERVDLALVEIVSGLYGQPLPPGYHFPFLDFGDPSKVRVGHPIQILGYPTAGGSGSRVSINYTRGVVSGFDNTDLGLVIKTDADISSGNSGGAALDEEHRLIGVPSYVVPEAEGHTQMGYVHAVSLLPARWRELIEQRRSR